MWAIKFIDKMCQHGARGEGQVREDQAEAAAVARTPTYTMHLSSHASPLRCPSSPACCPARFLWRDRQICPFLPRDGHLEACWGPSPLGFSPQRCPMQQRRRGQHRGLRPLRSRSRPRNGSTFKVATSGEGSKNWGWPRDLGEAARGRGEGGRGFGIWGELVGAWVDRVVVGLKGSRQVA
jgi:hypothetical protein